MESVSCPYTAVTFHRGATDAPGEQVGDKIPIPPQRPWSYTLTVVDGGTIHAALWWDDEAPVARLLAATTCPGDTYTVTVSADLDEQWTDVDDQLLELWMS